jgi:Domain of unknown function (DUF4234)
MAEEVQIRNTGNTAKIRNLWFVALFGLVTFGIYTLVWYYKINREMADLGRATGRSEELGDSPGMSLLAVTLGALIIVPAVISVVHTFQRVKATQRLTGGGEPLNGWLALVLALVIGPAFYAYLQSALNKSWESERSGGGTAALGSAPESVAAQQQQQQQQPQQP